MDDFFLEILEGDTEVGSFESPAVPGVGEVVTVWTGTPAGADSEVDYVVYRRTWTFRTCRADRSTQVRAFVTLDCHAATDPPPTYECGECGRRFHTELGVVDHARDAGHDGTSWQRAEARDRRTTAEVAGAGGAASNNATIREQSYSNAAALVDVWVGLASTEQLRAELARREAQPALTEAGRAAGLTWREVQGDAVFAPEVAVTPPVAEWRKKPVVISAFRLGTDPEPEWFVNDAREHILAEDGSCYVVTLEGRMLARPGDWIIRGIKGEVYPCKADIFEATYEPVTEAPPDDAAKAQAALAWLAARGGER